LYERYGKGIFRHEEHGKKFRHGKERKHGVHGKEETGFFY
jgi:hypothetical protein